MNEQHVIRPSRIETGSSMAEILVGISAVGLALVGLANIYPWVTKAERAGVLTELSAPKHGYAKYP